MPDKKDEKRTSNLKKLAYALTGTVAAGALTAAVAANIGFISADFDPEKYTRTQPKKEDDIVFDGVAYSDGDNRENKKKENTQSNKDDNKKDEQKPQSEPAESAAVPIITANVSENGGKSSETVNVDAVSGNGTGSGSNSGFLPVISENSDGKKILTDTGEGGKGDTPSGSGTAKDDTAVSERPSNGGGNTDNTPDTPDTPGTSPSGGGNSNPSGGGDTDNKPTDDKKHSGSSSGGGNSKPDTSADNSNPSHSQDEAPKRDDSSDGSNSDSGSSSGGHGGSYSGQPVGMEYSGSFMNLCVGQSVESIFSSASDRRIYLKFTNGSMTLKNGTVTVGGLNISGLDTSAARQGKAYASFTYETKRYNIEIPYSVTQWTAQLYMPDGTKFPTVFTPDKNLKLNLLRYYNTLKEMYPDFIGWRYAGGNEIYTTECTLTKPDTELFACVKGDAPDSDEVGEEYTLNGMTDVDISGFNVYPDCRKLVIGASVQNISGGKLGQKFPNLEEIEVSKDNSVYSSYDGVLYKDKTVMAVPPKKTSANIADGTENIGSYAFYGSEIKELVLPETVTEIGSYAFCDAKLDSLTVTAEKYSVGEGAFYASESDSPAVKKIISKTLYTADAKDGAEDFGKSLPQIILLDSKYDRVYQYYLSSWGYNIDKKYGEGTAVTVFSTQTGAQDRNTLINGAVYSFFSDKNQYTLTSVSTELEGLFKADEKTVDVAADAFYGCKKIAAVVFGENVKTLDDNALTGASALNSVTFEGATPTVTAEFFKNLNQTSLKIYVPAASYEEYLNKWSELIDTALGEGSAEKIININSDDVEVIDGARYTRDTNGLVLVRVTGDADKDFTVADGTYKIDNGAFGVKLDSVIIPETVTEIGTAPIGSGGGIGSVFVNSGADFDESAFDGCRLFVPETSHYEHDAYKFNDTYKPDNEGVIYADNTLLYVPDSFEGTFETAVETALILENAAKSCGGIRNVVISDSVTEIGDGAFEDCSGIENIDISEMSALEKIGAGAFYRCVSVSELNLPQSVKEIGESAFYGCDRLESISAYGAESIGDYAFMRCNALYRFNSNSVMNIPNSVTEMGKGAFAFCPLITEVKLPSEIRELKDGVFEGCVGLYLVSDWGKTEVIGENAFRSCGFVSAPLPPNEGVVVKSGAFAGCDKLDNVIVRSGIKEIAADFTENGAGAVTVFDGDMSLIENIDFNTMFENGCINDSVYVTNGTDLSEFLGEEHIHESPAGIYAASDLAGVYFTDGKTWATLEKVGKKCIDFDIIDNITVTGINDNAFSDVWDIETVKLRRTVGKLADYMFAGRQKLRRFDIPQNKTTSATIILGDGTFKDCPALETAAIELGISGMGSGTFENCTGLLQVSWGSLMQSIPDDTFNGCTSLSAFTITSNSMQNVISIGERCFKDCKDLVSLAGLGSSGWVFNALENVGSNAFEGCSSLSEITFGSTVKSLGAYVFEGCDNLSAIRVGGEPFEIGEKVLGSDVKDKYFYLGNVPDSIYESFADAWGERLGEDYGEDSVKALIVRDTAGTSDIPDDNVPIRSAAAKEQTADGTAPEQPSDDVSADDTEKEEEIPEPEEDTDAEEEKTAEENPSAEEEDKTEETEKTEEPKEEPETETEQPAPQEENGEELQQQ